MTKQEKAREVVYQRILKQLTADGVGIAALACIDVGAMADNIIKDLHSIGVVIEIEIPRHPPMQYPCDREYEPLIEVNK